MLQVGDHLAALRILALVVGDMDAAEDYCGKHAGPDGYLTLLDMLLRPGDSRPPLFVEACHLLAAQGGASLPLSPVIPANGCFSTKLIWQHVGEKRAAAITFPLRFIEEL